MPVRTDSGARPAQSAPAPKQVPAQKPAAGSAEDDSWMKVLNAKDTSTLGKDENGFDKGGTNFYLRDDEELEIIILDENPTIFNGHDFKLKSKKGTDYYTTEQCQMASQPHCLACMAGHQVRTKVVFRILDPRGVWKKNANGEGGDFDGKPAPKLFTTSVAFAKLIHKLKQDVGGKLTNKVMKLTKANKQYGISASMVPQGDGSMRYKAAPEYTGKLPNVLQIYATLPDMNMQNVLNSAAGTSPSNNQNTGTGGTQAKPNYSF